MKYSLFQYGFGTVDTGLSNSKIPVVEISNSSVLLAFSTSWLEASKVVHPLKPRSEKRRNILDFQYVFWTIDPGLANSKNPVVEMSNSSVLLASSTSWLHETRRFHPLKLRSEKVKIYLISVWFWDDCPEWVNSKNPVVEMSNIYFACF